MGNKYKFKYFFDFGSGGCLWGADKETTDTFKSPADAVIKDLEGNIIYNPLDKLTISKETLEKIQKLDERYYSYLNQDSPNESFIFDKESFISSAKELFNSLQKELGEDYKLIWDFKLE